MLKLFGVKFQEVVCDLVKKANGKSILFFDRYEEILNHCKMSSRLNSISVFKNDKLPSKIEAYLENKSVEPFLLTGLSGAG